MKCGGKEAIGVDRSRLVEVTSWSSLMRPVTGSISDRKILLLLLPLLLEV